MLFFSPCSLPSSGEIRFHSFELFKELQHPAHDPYQQVSTELNKIQQVEGMHQTLVTSLDYAAYPLMFLSPQFKYSQSEIVNAPEYMIQFCDPSLRTDLENKFSVHYEEIATIRSTCREAFRPEVFLRSFGRNQNEGTIGIYKLSSHPAH